MYQFLIISLFFFIYYISEVNGKCNQYYKCLDNSQVSNNLICQITEIESLEKTRISVRPCSSGYKCENNGLGVGNKACTSTFTLGTEGTSCILGLECESGLCIGGKCSVYSDNSSCLSSKECSSNSYCGANLKCNPVKSAGEACITNNECQYGYLCGKQEEKGDNVCVKMYSIASGKYASKKELCESGIVDKGECVDTYYALPEGKTVKECEKNDDCEMIVIRSDRNETTKGKCECTKLGNTYCEYSSKSNEWKNFVQVLSSEVDYYKAGTVNVLKSKSSDYLLNNKILQAWRKTDVRNYDVPDCILDALSSNWIKQSYLIIFFLFSLMY